MCETAISSCASADRSCLQCSCQLFDLSVRGHLGGLGLQASLIQAPTNREIPQEIHALFARARWHLSKKAVDCLEFKLHQ